MVIISTVVLFVHTRVNTEYIKRIFISRDKLSCALCQRRTRLRFFFYNINRGYYVKHIENLCVLFRRETDGRKKKLK